MTVHRPYDHDDDPEAIPLTAVPAYEERDLTEEHLPTYNEAVAIPLRTRQDVEQQEPTRPTTTTVPQPTQRRSHFQLGPRIPGQRWLPSVGVGLVWLLGLGFLVSGIVR